MLSTKTQQASSFQSTPAATINGLQLRPYQLGCIKAIKDCASQGKKRLLVSLPTGAGKTIIFSQLIKELGCKSLVLAHTSELLEQSQNRIENIAVVDVGLVDQYHKEFDQQVVVSSIQSAVIPSNLNQLIRQDFKLCIYDECHRAASDGARRVLNELGFGEHTRKLLCGFTATPFRHDNRKGLGEVFDIVAYSLDIEQLIKQGYLVPPVGYMIANDLDLSQVPTTDGDFQQASLSSVMDCDDMIAAIVDAYQKKAMGRKTICFGVSVKHSQHIADCFNSHDIKAELICGEMDRLDRQHHLEQYKTGDLMVLCNAQVLTEGVDLPETSCIIMSPTRSRLKFQQACGRGLRPAPWVNKRDCIILNFGDSDHKICNVAALMPDAQLQPGVQRAQSELQKIPKELNPKLKTAIASFDPLGRLFCWQHQDQHYFMEGNGDRLLQVRPQGHDKWMVTYTEGDQVKTLASGLDFAYAFGTAEEFAKQHKNLFVIYDLDASWRQLPISEKQKETLKSHGFKRGLEGLTRGQASIIIGSGVLGSRK